MKPKTCSTLASTSNRIPLGGIALLGLLIACAPIRMAQDLEEQQDAPVATTDDPAAVEIQAAEPEQDEPGKDAPPLVAESERVLRLDQGLEADRQTLAQLVGDLAEREALFAKMGEAEKNLIDEIAQLEEQGAGADPEQLEDLEGQLSRLKTQSDITLQSVRTMRTQHEALDAKITQDELAREKLLGIAPAAVEQAPSDAESSQPASSESAPVTIPGMPFLPAGDTTQTGGAAPAVEGHQTAEQIEADQEAAKLESRADEAEQEVVDFLSRKAALEEQIALQEQLLETAKASRDNLATALTERNQQLEEQIAEGADADAVDETREAIELIKTLADSSGLEIDQRNDQLHELLKRLQGLHEIRIAVTAEADERREEAEEALGRSVWLKSPFHPQNIADWALERGPRILLVLMAAAAALLLLRLTLGRVARVVIRKGRGHRTNAKNRAHTLASSFRSAGNVLIVLSAMLLVLEEAGIDIKTVLGGAAILGVAIAFGAQNLMRDYFTGFLILLEDQFEIGDLITIGSITGTVERVNMRTTMLRDLEGRMHFIPNGEIKSLTNRTYVWGRAVFEIPVGFDEDVERVMKVLLELAQDLCKDPEFGPGVTDEPEMLGVDKFTESGVIIKFMLRTAPEKMFVIRREMLRRVKNRFDELGIRISVPHRIMMPVAESHDD
jgi:small-conductance mechanosensitive channel